MQLYPSLFQAVGKLVKVIDLVCKVIDEILKLRLNRRLARVSLMANHADRGRFPFLMPTWDSRGQAVLGSQFTGRYFSVVQPYQHHTRTPAPGINVYSFALKPEEHQPSGSCNFSRIDKATLQLTVSVNTVTGSRTAQVRVYALNYNVLRVMSGMGGLAYSN